MQPYVSKFFFCLSVAGVDKLMSVESPSEDQRTKKKNVGLHKQYVCMYCFTTYNQSLLDYLFELSVNYNGRNARQHL